MSKPSRVSFALTEEEKNELEEYLKIGSGTMGDKLLNAFRVACPVHERSEVPHIVAGVKVLQEQLDTVRCKLDDLVVDVIKSEHASVEKYKKEIKELNITNKNLEEENLNLAEENRELKDKVAELEASINGLKVELSATKDLLSKNAEEGKIMSDMYELITSHFGKGK